MEYRSAITLKAGDAISIPGLGEKRIGAIHQIRHDRYQIRLDEKFVESVRVDVVIGNGEHRAPERHDGPWTHEEPDPSPKPAGSEVPRQSPEQLFREMEHNALSFLKARAGQPSLRPAPEYEFPGDAHP